ncbi:hypothetical protein AWC19_11105 [Mycobacterium palustre]|uniref:Uncharacterized protein n=1 Tax=Mycobacterium palustre TaxID=153971 RepID=A0A1X1ZK10_9MYCO|nr:hypothetical protein AWC19_11105 [Mycobacterium palustre]
MGGKPPVPVGTQNPLPGAAHLQLEHPTVAECQLRAIDQPEVFRLMPTSVIMPSLLGRIEASPE